MPFMDLATLQNFTFTRKRTRDRAWTKLSGRKRRKFQKEKAQKKHEAGYQKRIEEGEASAASTNKLNLKSKDITPDLTRIIIWLRNDLRLHDNYALNWAMKYDKNDPDQMTDARKEVLIVYCFDEAIYNS